MINNCQHQELVSPCITINMHTDAANRCNGFFRGKSLVVEGQSHGSGASFGRGTPTEHGCFQWETPMA